MHSHRTSSFFRCEERNYSKSALGKHPWNLKSRTPSENWHFETTVFESGLLVEQHPTDDLKSASRSRFSCWYSWRARNGFAYHGGSYQKWIKMGDHQVLIQHSSTLMQYTWKLFNGTPSSWKNYEKLEGLVQNTSFTYFWIVNTPLTKPTSGKNISGISSSCSTLNTHYEAMIFQLIFLFPW